MKRIDIDFSNRGWRMVVARTGWTEFAMLILLLLTVVLGGVAVNTESQRARATEGRLKTNGDRRGQNVTTVAQVTNPVTPKMAAAANEVVRQLNLPWNDLLAAIERNTPRRILLIAIEPDAARHVLRLEAEAPTPEAMLDYVAKLHTDSFFSAVSMVRHETKETKSGNVIGFVVEAAWKEPSGE
jgi:hypothetical protein